MKFDTIFIVGTGRSGTHHTCRCFLDFENITDELGGKENSSLLQSITESAVENTPLTQDVISYYKDKVAQTSTKGKIFLDQCHPNLYHYEQLSSEFDKCLFLGIDRPIEQIVGSMLNHKGVSGWYTKLKNNVFKNIKYPNNFFGLRSESELYDLPMYLLCAKRVIAHKKIIKTLDKKENFKTINFENFVKDKVGEFHSLFSKSILESFGEYEEKQSSVSSMSVLTKFEKTLSPAQVQEMKELEKKHLVLGDNI